MHLIDQPVDSEVQAVNEYIREFVNTKIVDPNLRYGKVNDVSFVCKSLTSKYFPNFPGLSLSIIKPYNRKFAITLLLLIQGIF